MFKLAIVILALTNSDVKVLDLDFASKRECETYAAVAHKVAPDKFKFVVVINKDNNKTFVYTDPNNPNRTFMFSCHQA